MAGTSSQSSAPARTLPFPYSTNSNTLTFGQCSFTSRQRSLLFITRYESPDAPTAFSSVVAPSALLAVQPVNPLRTRGIPPRRLSDTGRKCQCRISKE